MTTTVLTRVKSKSEVIAPIQNKKEARLLGCQVLRPGLTLFEVNTKTGDIQPVTYKEVIARFDGGIKRKVEVKSDCVYIQALNVKNVLKKLKRGW